MFLVAEDNYKYGEYKSPNWIKGRKYRAKDDGKMLIVESEHGKFFFGGIARQWMLSNFQVEEGDEA